MSASRIRELEEQRDELQRKINELEIDLQAIKKKIQLYEKPENYRTTDISLNEGEVFGPSEALEFVMRSQPQRVWSAKELVRQFSDMIKAGKAETNAKKPADTVRWVLRSLRDKEIVESFGSRARLRYKLK